MARSVLTVDLKDDQRTVDAYRRHHQHVWPEVLASLQRAGIRRMDIFLLERRLVMIVETDGRDFADCMRAHVAGDGRVVEWEALMRSMQEPPPGAAPGDWWSVMEPIFTLNGAG
jgi:L-rhamnose mutarotase